MTLKRALRLRKDREFQQVRQRGRRITSRLLALAWMPNDVAQLRIGFVVSKRVSKRAVDRNHLKRLLSEALRPSLGELSSGWDIVFSAKKETLMADLRTLEQEMPALLGRARLLTPTRQTGDELLRNENRQ